MPVDVEALRQQNLRIKTAFTSVFPFFLALVFITCLFLGLPFEQAAVLFSILLAYVFSPAGKETLIPLMIVLGYPWWLVVGCLLVTDICCALVVSWNFRLLLRIPWIGAQLRKWTGNAGRYQETHPGLARLAGIGLFFFTMIPFQGFGTITGTIVGTMLGMKPVRLFLTVVGGGFVTSLILAYGLNALARMYATHPYLVTVIAVILAVITLVAYICLKMSANKNITRTPGSGGS